MRSSRETFLGGRDLNKRKLKLEDYGISKKRYKELCGFCEQYPEWLSYLNRCGYSIKGVTYSDMPKANRNSDPTCNIAIKRNESRERCEERCEIIEQTAIQASGELYPYIIKSVCYEVPFDYLQTMDEIPCSRAAFYDVKRYFFLLLHKNKIM